MFRKKLAVLVAAALMTLSASSAFAAFADLQLIRVVYERTTGTTESATDLGNLQTLLSAPSTTITGPALSATSANNLFVAYFAIDRSTTAGASGNQFWVSGSTTVAPVAVGAAGFNSTKSGITNVFSYYNSLGTGTVTAAQSHANSYMKKLTASQGAMGNGINIATRVNTEAKLASLVTGASTSVSQNLYYFINANTGNAKGVNVASITTNSDGSTTVTTTPIPAAFYLMGSGLLGLVGLRRRNKVA